MSKLDWIYRRFLVTQIFTKGWGKPDNLRRIFNFRKKISNREICQHLVAKDHPVYIDKETKTNGCRLLDGHFMSPLVSFMPDIVPKEVQVARFQMLLPAEWKSDLRPVCLHLGGTGDHGFWRRKKFMADPLLKDGIASIILENPYYGCRKPKEQLRSSLHNVSDLFVMGGGLILESLVLFNWCERMGYGPLGASGISMGGHMASLAATNWPKPLSLIPCLSWSTASGVFTTGVLSSAIPWKVLQHQYSGNDVYEKEIKDLIESPEPYWQSGAYSSGQEFARRFTESTDTEQLLAMNSNGSVSITEKYISDSLKEKYTEHSPLHIQDQCLERSSLEKDCASLNSSISGSAVASMNSSIGAGGAVASMNSSIGGRINQTIKSAQNLSVVKDKVLTTTSIGSQLEKDCRLFMRGVMDECTHLGNFSTPVDPELIIIVAADHDSYIPRDDVLPLDKLWPGSEVRYIPTGHIVAFLSNHDTFRKAIVDSFKKQIQKYY